MRLAKFFVDDRHAWLDNSHPEWGRINMGADGSNLTVVFLSMNRATLSIRLVQSFIEHVPQFGGRFLIADNGSDDAQLVLLEGFLAAKCPFPYEILRFGKNYGVAGGRNRAFAEVKTDWILSLDNDIFLIGNPFPTLSRDIGLLGCHFLSVPLLNLDRQTFLSFGGHLSPSMVERHHPFLETGFILPPGSALSQST